MAWAERFFDDFDDNSVGVQTDAQNGTITEPAGTELVLSCSATDQCQWDDAGQGRPCAYEEIITHDPEGSGLYKFETKVSGFTKTGVEVLAGLCLWGPDSRNTYLTGWYDSNDDVYLQRLVEFTEWSTLYNAGNYGNPETTPHIYQLYLNLTSRRQYLEDFGVYLEPNQIGFRFSANNGSSYVWAYKETLAFVPTRFGVYARNWSTTFRGFDASFDYLGFWEWDGDLLKVDEPTGGNDETHPQPKAAIEESALPVKEDQEGPIDHRWGFSAGQRLPGPPAQQTASVGPFDVASIEEGVDPSLSQTGEPYHGQPEWDAGHIPTKPHPTAGLEVPVFGGIVDADYLPEKDDGDGVELIQGPMVFTAKKPSWAAPAAGLYGTGRDGKNYYNGAECSPSGPGGLSFGTVAGGPNRVCWSIWDQSPPLDYAENATPIVVSIPVDGTARFVGTALTGQATEVGSLWYFTGDFDVSVDWSNFSESGGSDGGPSLVARTDPSNLIYVRRRITAGVAENGRLDSAVKVNNSYGTTYAFADALGATSGKFRITRTGTTVRRYYWNAAWVEIGSGVDMGRAEPMHVAIQMWGTGTVNLSMDWSNVVITSGATSNEVAWAREALGTHRGNLNAFPTNPGIVTTFDSLNIIDLATDKLWMRWTEGTGQCLNPDWAGTDTWVHEVAFDDGVMLVAWHGAMVYIDFNLSWVLIARLVTDTNRGARRKDTHGADWRGDFGMASDTNSPIVTRNGSEGFSTPSYDDWAIPSRDVNSVDLWHDGGYQYRFIGTAAGIRIQKWRRWYFSGTGNEHFSSPDWSAWATANNVQWIRVDKSSGELFWTDTADMHSRARSGAGGWETVMSGATFTASTTKALPGTRNFPPQYKAIRFGSYLFIPAAEGVYRVDWPSGSWTLFYGKVGSGATHEILNPYDFIHAIELGNDGTYDLLAIASAKKHAGQVTLVRLDTNVVYGLSRVEDLKIANVVAA